MRPRESTAAKYGYATSTQRCPAVLKSRFRAQRGSARALRVVCKQGVKGSSPLASTLASTQVRSLARDLDVEDAFVVLHEHALADQAVQPSRSFSFSPPQRT